jgi:PleD family two-component response regulator
MPGFATEMAGASIDPLQPVKAQQLYPSPPILKRVHTSPVLPASPTVGTSTLPTDVEPSETPPHPLEVLVVDDDPLTRKLMSRMLTRLGNRVTTAENGAVGLAHIVESWKTDSGPDHRPPRVDVVFLDK